MPVTGPLTPYITPQILTAAPTGVSWSTIPGRNATPDEQLAEQLNICARATSMVDTACNQVLRATVDTETLTGPDFRVTIQRQTGNARLILSRWPVLQVLGGRWALNQPPYQWQDLPADQWAVEVPVIGLYGTSAPSDAGEGGQSVLLAPGHVSWANGRHGCAIQVTYVNGWPHTSLTAAAQAGATTIEVDDCTGWAPATPGGQGATGVVHDGANQEAVTVTSASAVSGPGTLTLAQPLTASHAAGVVVTTLPEQIMWAAVLFATAQALTRGATATTVQQVPGSAVRAGGEPDALIAQATALCAPFRRTI